MRCSSAVLLAVSMLPLGCATTQASPQMRAWWARRDAHPAIFTVPEARAEAVWQRAIECVAQNSGFPVLTQTDNLIETGTANGRTSPYDDRLAMRVTRVKTEDGWRFSFSASSVNPFAGELERRLAQGCAYQADTGDFPPNS